MPPATPRVAACLLLLAASAVAQEPAGWRSALPAEWLVAVEAPDLARLERDLGALLRPWGLKPAPLAGVLAVAAPGARFAERPWAIALTATEAGGVTPVLFAPTDDFAALCEAVRADRAEDLAVATLAGFDVALAEHRGWARVTLLDDATPPDAPTATQAVPAGEADALLTAHASPSGLRNLADLLQRRRRGQIDSGRGRFGPWRWPQGFDAYVSRLAPYHPLAEAAADLDAPLTLSLSLDGPDGALRATLVAPVPTPVAPVGVAPPALPGENPRIGELVSPAHLPGTLIDIQLAWMRCRPDEIDAAEYPQPQWDDFAQAYRDFASRYAAARSILTLPGEGEPVAANQSSVFRWDGDAASLGDALQMLVVRWNGVIDATETRTPLRIELAPIAPGDPTAGWTITIDLVKGIGLPPSPELEALFNRYYGAGNLLVCRVTPTADGGWLAHLTAPPESAPETTATERAAPPPDDTLLHGELRLDLLTRWWRLLDDVNMQDAIGRRVRPPMAEAPAATLTVTGGETLRAVVTLPHAAYEAATTHGSAERVEP